MAAWSCDAKTGTLLLLGGSMTMARLESGPGLYARWSSPTLKAITVSTALAHVPRFAVEPGVAGGVAKSLLAQILQAQWMGLSANWPDSDAVKAVQRALIGDQASSGAACWIGPVALRNHLSKCHPDYLEAFAGEPAPQLFTAQQDPF